MIILERKIFNIFLGLPNYGIMPIIRLKPCTKKNSTYVQVPRTESTCKGLTRNFESSTSAYTTILLTSQLKKKATHRRGKRESGKKKKEAVKVNLGVIKKKSK